MDISAQLQNALEGRYTIEREIGAGGMATVYLARDVKHHRRVALKVLRPELGAVLGGERFLSEIEVTANLQHPHLLPLFDSGEIDGLLFYVMPFIEGESLRQRLQRERQLPVDEAVRIAAAVAGALDYAHRHNVIHRDLKPENILLHEGQPLVTDFGISLAVSKAGGARITQTGLSLGTPQYMSPEQATGDRAIDARSDIYSLGAVTYEMLTGEPPHTGATVQAIIARVLTDRPHSVRATRETVPEHVEAAVMCALAKLPADRFATAGDFAAALTGARAITLTPPAGTAVYATTGAQPAGMPGRRRLRALAPWGVAAAALALGGASVLVPRRTTPAGWPSLFEVTFSDTVTVLSPPGHDLNISRDGSQLAFVGAAGGSGGIFLRRLEDFRAEPVRGAESAYSPAFSPDGAWLLFHSSGKLKKVPVVGGAAITVVDSAGNTSHWGDRDQILYTFSRGLWRVSAEGGVPTRVAMPDSARGHLSYNMPHVLPGGRAALLTLFKGTTGVAGAQLGVVELPAGEVRELGIPGANPRYVSSGHIVFARSDGSVFAAPFSLRRLEVTGPVVPVLEGVVIGPGGATELAVSETGTLVYKMGQSARRKILVVDRRGNARPLTETEQSFANPRVSPDGRRLAVALAEPQNDIWTYDFASKTLTRLSTDGNSIRPEWTPDGRRVVYVAGDVGHVSAQPWDGSGAPESYLPASPSKWEVSLGPPGSYLAVRQVGPTQDIWIAPTDSPRALRPFLTSPADERMPSVSPDGQFLAYASDEPGRFEVYVRPLPGPGPRIQVSTNGGTEPVWAPNGRELFYRSPPHFMAATITTAPELTVVRRDTLFADTYLRNPTYAAYDVFPNGREFVMVQGASALSQIFAIVNWTEELRRRVRESGARQ